MKSAAGVLDVGYTNEPRHDIRAQLAEYVAQQPASKQSFHKWMRFVEWVSLALPAAVFAIALYLSITWKIVSAQTIAAAWLCFPLSFTPLLILIGLHTIGLQAWPPTTFLGKTMRVYFPLLRAPSRTQPLRTGQPAVVWGWGAIAVALITGAFWGVFAWAAWTVNLAMLTPLITLLGYALGIAIAGSILFAIFSDIYRRTTRSR